MQRTIPTDSVEETVTAIRRVGLALKARFTTRLAEHGLTYPQALVLRALRRAGRLTAREIADLLAVTPANVTGILDRLERDQLVTRSRNPDDRRVVYVRLTERGHEKIDAIKLQATLVADLFEGWTEDEHAQLRALLAKVRLGPQDEDSCP